MQMRVDRLREVLTLLQPVIPRKTTLPVLANVLLKDGKAVATDLETAVALELPEAKGECLVPHHAAANLLKYVPGYEPLTIDQEGKNLSLSWEGGKASYDVAEPEDYPPIPEVKATAEHTVDGDTLVPALLSMVGYCATEDTRPVLCGVTLSFGDTLAIAASNGFKLAYQVLPIAFPAEGVETAIISTRTIHILGHLWDKTPRVAPLESSLVRVITARRQLELSLGGGLLKVELLKAKFGRAALVIQLIQGTPPNFKQLIPSETPLKVQVFAADLERAVRRLQGIAKDGSGIVRLTWTEDTMTVSAKSEDKGEAEAQVSVKTEGGPGRVAVNVRYLLDYLQGKEGVVTVGVESPSSPILFRHGTSPLVVIMPMFDQAATPKVVAQAEAIAAEANYDPTEETEAGEQAEDHPPKPKRKRKTKQA